MLQSMQELIIRQYEAALSTLRACVIQCPKNQWRLPVVNQGFDQVVFHVLFYADLYLDDNLQYQRRQEFHQQHSAVFAGYEQVEDREPVDRYEPEFLLAYLDHCRDKVRRVVGAETAISFDRPVEFPWLDLPRGEMHVYNIRHIQHHSAQLIAVLRREHQIDLPWFRSGWKTNF